MIRFSFLSILIGVVGLVAVSSAVFAGVLGLDNNPGWGRLRIAVLICGILMVMGAGFFFLFKDRLYRSLEWIRPLLGNISTATRKPGAGTAGFLKRYRFLTPVVTFVILLYIWLISSGTWTSWISPTRYYANLARGFRYGNLHIPTRPDPRLLELPNPYDPSMRGAIEFPPDISLYNGHYYLYWGPVPSLILLALQPVYHGRIGDLFLVFGFVCGIFLFQVSLATLVWDRFFNTLPRWILSMSVLLMGLAGPTPFILNNFYSARIYEAAITGGQFFLIGGLLVAWTVFDGQSSPWRLALASTLWVLAIGTRFILLIPTGLLSLLLVAWIVKRRSSMNKNVVGVISVTLPLLFGIACLGWYNWARFGSVVESGLYYQLAGWNIQESYGDLMDVRNIAQNIYNYLFNPFLVDAQFPFLFLDVGRQEPAFSFLPPRPIYASQYITGLIYLTPFCLYAFVAMKIMSPDRVVGRNDPSPLKWISLALSGSSLAAFGFLMMFFWGAMRYMVDFMPSLMLLAVIGYWQGSRALSGQPGHDRLYHAMGIVLSLASILISFLVGVSINDARFIVLHWFSN
jgi:hypothetical protein